MAQGYSGDIMQQKSRFLSEIPATLLEQWNIRASHPWAAYHQESQGRSEQNTDAEIENNEPF
jgi:hypothetical protein